MFRVFSNQVTCPVQVRRFSRFLQRYHSQLIKKRPCSFIDIYSVRECFKHTETGKGEGLTVEVKKKEKGLTLFNSWF